MYQRPAPSRIPNVVPLRAIDVTIVEPGTCPAHSVSDFAAAIAGVRKNRWLTARKSANGPRTSSGSAATWPTQERTSRLVAAWVRMCRSSPIAMPCAAIASTSSGPDRASTADSAGPATSRSSRSRATAASVSRPNHATSPGPWLIGANARNGPDPSSGVVSTTSTGADGPIALAMGTTMSWWFAGSRRTSPAARSRSASPVSAAQPSATAAARIERRSGSHTSSQPIAGPQCSSIRPPTPGTTSSTRVTAVRNGTPVSRRRSTSALAASISGPRSPYSLVRARTASGSPPAGGRQSTWVTVPPWARTASANIGRPTFTTSIASGSVRVGALIGCPPSRGWW